MILAIIIVSSVVFYLVAGAFIGKGLFNHFIEPHYKKQLSYYTNPTAKNIENAYSKAKLYSEVDMEATLGGIFWFIGIWILLFVKMNKSHISILPKSLAQKDLAKAQKRDTELASLNAAIKEAKAAGIDTKELENIVRIRKADLKN